MVTCPASVTYDGAAQTPCTVDCDRCRWPEHDSGRVLCDNTDAGTATAGYRFAGDANHDGSSDSKDFTIYKRNVTA